MTLLPNPFLSNSAIALVAGPVGAPNRAPARGASAELLQEPAQDAIPVRAEPAAGGVAPSAPAAFSFQPDFEQMFDFILRDLHPRDLDFDPPPKFLRNPSPEYLSALLPPIRRNHP